MNTCISNEPKHYSIYSSNRTHLIEKKCSDINCKNCTDFKYTQHLFGSCRVNNTYDSRRFLIEKMPNFSNNYFFMKFYRKNKKNNKNL
jgi:hypothetical protein